MLSIGMVKTGLGTLGTSKSKDPHLNIGLIVPHSIWEERTYTKKIKTAVQELNRKGRGRFTFLEKYKFECGSGTECEDVEKVMVKVNPSPRGNEDKTYHYDFEYIFYISSKYK